MTSRRLVAFGRPGGQDRSLRATRGSGASLNQTLLARPLPSLPQMFQNRPVPRAHSHSPPPTGTPRLQVGKAKGCFGGEGLWGKAGQARRSPPPPHPAATGATPSPPLSPLTTSPPHPVPLPRAPDSWTLPFRGGRGSELRPGPSGYGMWGYAGRGQAHRALPPPPRPTATNADVGQGRKRARRARRSHRCHRQAPPRMLPPAPLGRASAVWAVVWALQAPPAPRGTRVLQHEEPRSSQGYEARWRANRAESPLAC